MAAEHMHLHSPCHINDSIASLDADSPTTAVLSYLPQAWRTASADLANSKLRERACRGSCSRASKGAVASLSMACCSPDARTHFDLIVRVDRHVVLIICRQRKHRAALLAPSLTKLAWNNTTRRPDTACTDTQCLCRRGNHSAGGLVLAEHSMPAIGCTEAVA